MTIRAIPGEFTVCQVCDVKQIDLTRPFTFAARTDEELSLVCLSDNVPVGVCGREDGWRAFRIEGVLDFSLVGILARIAGLLAAEGIPIFAISTFNTDYVLVKAEAFDRALQALEHQGYEILQG